MVALGQGTLRLLDRDGKTKSQPRFLGRGWTGRMRREFFGNDQIITPGYLYAFIFILSIWHAQLLPLRGLLSLPPSAHPGPSRSDTCGLPLGCWQNQGREAWLYILIPSLDRHTSTVFLSLCFVPGYALLGRFLGRYWRMSRGLSSERGDHGETDS